MEGQMLEELMQRLREVGGASSNLESSFEVKENPLRVNHESLVSTRSHHDFEDESPTSYQKRYTYWQSLGSVKSVVHCMLDEGK